MRSGIIAGAASGIPRGPDQGGPGGLQETTNGPIGVRRRKTIKWGRKAAELRPTPYTEPTAYGPDAPCQEPPGQTPAPEEHRFHYGPENPELHPRAEDPSHPPPFEASEPVEEVVYDRDNAAAEETPAPQPIDRYDQEEERSQDVESEMPHDRNCGVETRRRSKTTCFANNLHAAPPWRSESRSPGRRRPGLLARLPARQLRLVSRLWAPQVQQRLAAWPRALRPRPQGARLGAI